MKRVAVLGARGFLGSYICHNLRDHVILPVTRDTLDLTDHASVGQWLDRSQPDVIVNCATAGGKQSLGQQIYNDYHNNLQVFINFYNQSQRFQRLINIGSGAEFDVSRSIDLAEEADIFKARVIDSYGASKNLISRLCSEKENFYTLRLFGIFHNSEPGIRLLKKCVNQNSITISDREFDMISASDFLQVLEHYITETPFYRDINCVYPHKTSLETIVREFAGIHNKSLMISVDRPSAAKNYTGSGEKLRSLGIPLQGLHTGLVNYG